ncbi:MAG: tRNA (adenosine(37)-N6)-threonylcarbamoyltransferase complex ATPase subunit type 1 TsaE, partial [Gammaproteobacteria bacterium]|nr:tRNA (adenosine(37)-N6)-threonylcarbamoyltransferase complex ATPase subunit type 1 TsaE [Gammaproteobacteria bacterium]
QFGQTVMSADKPVMLALEGNLGAGKSFFARSLLQQFGVTGAVRSPTYTLIEPYECELGTVLHLDLYRLADPEEVLYLGLEDQLVNAALVMVEWPEKASGYLDNYDVRLTLEVTAESRRWQLTAISDMGERLLRQLTTE